MRWSATRLPNNVLEDFDYGVGWHPAVLLLHHVIQVASWTEFEQEDNLSIA